MVANVLTIINLPMALENLPIAANDLQLVSIGNDIQVIPGYEFIYEIMKLNISKIKHHNYEVLNLQVYLIVLVLTHENL